jgi:hypothetical protein
LHRRAAAAARHRDAGAAPPSACASKHASNQEKAQARTRHRFPAPE